MNRLGAVRIWIATAVVAVGGLIRTATFVQEVDVLGVLRGEAQSDVSDHDRRFAAVKEKLATETTVGYLTPLPPERLWADPIQAAYFFQAQYSLAPVLVVPKLSPLRIVADLQALAHHSAVFEADDGEVMLFLPTLDMRTFTLEANLKEDVQLYRHRRQ